MRNKVLSNSGLFVSEMCLGTLSVEHPAWVFAMADAARANLLRSGVRQQSGART